MSLKYENEILDKHCKQTELANIFLSSKDNSTETSWKADLLWSFRRSEDRNLVYFIVFLCFPCRFDTLRLLEYWVGTCDCVNGRH